MYRIITFILLLSAFCSYGTETQFQDAYLKGLMLGKQSMGRMMDATHTNPKSIYKEYNEHPKEADYFKKNKKRDDDLKNAIKYETNHNEISTEIIKDSAGRPKFEIQKNTQSMNMNQWILDNAYQLTHEKSCREIPSCVTNFENINCFEKPKSISHLCTQKLVVDVKQTVDEKHYPITVHLQSDRYYMAARINLTNGQVIDHGPRESSASIQGLIPGNIDCNTLSGSVKSINLAGNLVSISFPSCAGLNIDVRIENSSKNHRTYGSILVDIVSRHLNNNISEYWTNNCSIYTNNNQCTINEEKCTEGLETRNIGGVPITRSCWTKEAKYTCAFSSDVLDTCKPLRDKGCEQIGSVCKDWQENQCTSYAQTFRCPKKDCSYQTLCTTIPSCINGDCSQHEKIPDPDFNQAVGSFGALVDAAKSMDKSTQAIFTGKATSCSTAIKGYLNCCGDGGWGELLNEKCDKDEIELQHLREKHLTIQIPGEYCGHKVAGICVSYRKRYCVFPTKIARLIQEEGRLAQLGRKFGTAEEPNCSGITPEDLQHIDFSKIDFSEIAEDIKNSLPLLDQATLIEKMNKKVQESSKSDAN